MTATLTRKSGPAVFRPEVPTSATLTHVVGDQSAVMRFMADPASHSLPSDDASRGVERIDTHGAAVFLAGERAYKIKRAVCFPFMDFSTLARREEACRAEIAINKPNAPEIYLDTVAITRDKLGHLAINGQGEAIEWAVAMRRFDTAMTFDQLAANGQLTQTDLDGAVDAIISFQGHAPIRRADDWVADLSAYIDQNDQAFHEAHKLFGLQETAEPDAAGTTAEWRLVRPILLARGEAQAVRRCHGDLHLRNLVRMPAGVRMFDAVEFDERHRDGRCALRSGVPPDGPRPQRRTPSRQPGSQPLPGAAR
jgi:aminoglycoside phosphotransferase family enzyme